MISKRTAIILIVAIVAIIFFEMNFSFDKMSNVEENLEHTVAQISLTIDGETTDLEGTEVEYTYASSKETLSAALGKLNETGFEGLPYNYAGYKPCGKGSNKLSLTIPEEVIPTYNSDIIVTFGCENNQWDFNNYSLVINLTTVDKENIKAELTQTLYYPDESGKALSQKKQLSSVINSEQSKIDIID